MPTVDDHFFGDVTHRHVLKTRQVSANRWHLGVRLTSPAEVNVWDPSDKHWQFRMEGKDSAGNWKPFAVDTLRRASQ